MNTEIGREIVVGEKICLDVVKDKGGSVGLGVEFVDFDVEVKAREHGKEVFFCSDVDCQIFHGSMRIYRLEYGERLKLVVGERIRANVAGFVVSDHLTKDGRYKIYVTLANARRVYSWERGTEWTGKDFLTRQLVIKLMCGERTLKHALFPLTEVKGEALCDNKIYSTSRICLPNGSVLMASNYFMSLVDSYLAEKRKVLGRLVSLESLRRIVRNLPKLAESSDFDRSDRREVMREREEARRIAQRSQR